MTTTTYTDARANLAKLMEKVTNDYETVTIQRRGHEDVVMISASEYASLEETAHLLRSPENAKRLLSALNRALADDGEPQTIDVLKQEIGLE